MLNGLNGNQLVVDGEGTYITALASKDGEKVSLLLTNYDESGRNTELVPIIFKNLTKKRYNITKINLNGQKTVDLNVLPIHGEIRLVDNKGVLMPPYSIVGIQLEPVE